MENNKENAELKPCPFCGGTNLDIQSGDVRFNGGITWNHNMVRCKKCGGMVLLSVGKNAIDAWNKRTVC